jgi:hypothetical protein
MIWVLILTRDRLVVSEQLVRLKLAQEVEEGEQGDNASVEGLPGDDHPSVVILNGLRLEDDQYVYSYINLLILIKIE